VRKQHSQNKACQYKLQENSYFVNYPCLYCDKVITSKEELAEHYMTCSEGLILEENYQEVPDQFDECYFSFDLCIEKFSCFEDLGDTEQSFMEWGQLK
jgi:hypothetical protein